MPYKGLEVCLDTENDLRFWSLIIDGMTLCNLTYYSYLIFIHIDYRKIHLVVILLSLLEYNLGRL
jgi:hypothetical protein